MTEPYLSDRFVVLGRRPFRDNDAHLVLLGEQLGKCVALAKGVGKPTSKLSSLLEVGNLIEAELYDGKAGYTLLSASQVAGFSRRFASYEALCTSVTICELTDAALEQGPGEEEVFHFLTQTLAAMNDRNLIEMRLRFEWALLQWSGYASDDPQDFLTLLARFWRTESFSPEKQALADELLAFFSVPLASARVGDYLLSKQARKTMRRLLDKLISSQLSLRLKSVALLDAATMQFYP